jgi:hypothetical protein
MLDTINPVNIPETISFTKLVDKVNSPTLFGLLEEPDQQWAKHIQNLILSSHLMEKKRTSF